MSSRRRENRSDGNRSPSLKAFYLGEPELTFCGGRTHVDPKAGLDRFGPKSWSGNPDERRDSLRVGFIGQPEAIRQARAWLHEKAKGVPGQVGHPEFPGCAGDRGFMLSILTNDGWDASLLQKEIREFSEPRLKRDRFALLLELLDSKLKFLAERDQPPEYVLLALSKDMYSKFRAIDYNDRARCCPS